MKAPKIKVNSHDLLQLLEKKHFKPTIPVDRQVADHLRGLILKAKIPAYTQLPSIRAMAELWDTNYHTVHDALSRLVGEGLVILRPVRGSFVAPPRRVLRRVCLYHNYQLKSLVFSGGDFYSCLNVILYGLLSKRGMVVVPYYDHRSFDKLHIIPPEVRKMASEGEIDAVIATDIYPVHAPWLLNLEVPVASLMLNSSDRKIEVDILKLAKMVVDQAVKANRQTIGVINWPVNLHLKGRKEDVLRVEIRRLAALRGISVIAPKDTEPNSGKHPEQLGAELCEQLLKAAVPPDFIFVYPDTLMRGVATALIKHQVRVPKQILLVSHRNAENIMYIPFPMIWLTVKIEDFAQALIDQIERQILGEELASNTINLEIERTPLV